MKTSRSADVPTVIASRVPSGENRGQMNASASPSVLVDPSGDVMLICLRVMPLTYTKWIRSDQIEDLSPSRLDGRDADAREERTAHSRARIQHRISIIECNRIKHRGLTGSAVQ